MTATISCVNEIDEITTVMQACIEGARTGTVASVRLDTDNWVNRDELGILVSAGVIMRN